MAEMTLQDLAAMQELTKEKHSGKWSENTALWSIVIVLIILALMWYVNRIGADKADLAAAVQSTVSRVNSLEIAASAQGNDIKSLNSVLSATTQAVATSRLQPATCSTTLTTPFTVHVTADVVAIAADQRVS